MSGCLLEIGGTLRAGSSSELALCRLDVAAPFGATTRLLTARELRLLPYDPAAAETPDAGEPQVAD